jgi:hydrogenase nickel incorporation protein HypA/HybF
MHEYSIVQSLLGRVEASVRGYEVNTIRRLKLRIGELSGVDAGLLRTAYEMCIPGTLCEGAALEILDVPARWRCANCEQDAPRGQRLTCAACGGAVRLVEGDEILLETIDLEVDDV